MKQIFKILPLLLIFQFFWNSFSMAQENDQKAIFAGGCFWCVESDFEKLDGVIEVVSGYAGGSSKNPTYHDYSQKGHIEVVEITFDPDAISYEELLDYFWRHVDPTDAGGQFCDRGHAYTTAIFYLNEEQEKQAQESKSALNASKQLNSPIVTNIIKATDFYPAEDYHQDYYRKNPVRYNAYRFNCGRDRKLKKLWRK